MSHLDLIPPDRELIDFRRDIHRHPELAFAEFRTADLIAEQLEKWGITVVRGMAKTSVIGILRLGHSEKSIGLRADMDALPIQEKNTFSHASAYAGKMHACGHDGHVAMLLAAAKYLAQTKSFDGTVYFIFQPAEEGGGGANVMVDEGLFATYPMDFVFGMHNWPGLPVGSFAISKGPVMASSSEFAIRIIGKGGHAAIPHETIDPIPIACQIIQSFQTIISRFKKPQDPAVLSVTVIQAGEASNVIPDTCEIKGTVRTFTLETLDLIEQLMREMAEHIARAHGAQIDFLFNRSYPPTINHPSATSLAKDVIDTYFGLQHYQPQTPSLGAEDFAYFLQVCSGAYLFIGNGAGDHREGGHAEGACVLHNPSYDFNDGLIQLGGTFWVRLIEHYLR
jgi:amidohydrolase